MALRLIQMVIPQQEEEAAQRLLEERGVKRFWYGQCPENLMMLNILLSSESTESVLDELEKRFSSYGCFQIVILPVEASIPVEKKKANNTNADCKPCEKKAVGRVHRLELYTDIKDVTVLSRVYMVMVLLSSFVAAIGLMRDNVAVVIGAMVIAPLLGPNVALALATTLGDYDLARTALKTSFAGILLAVVVAFCLGAVLDVNPATPEILSRTRVDLVDLALALAAGAAGALSFNQGSSSALIGVMVAVALLPPLVTFGMLLGSGHIALAFGAFLLFCANLICVNLAGVVTFLVQGVRPLAWLEVNAAQKSSRYAIWFWFLLLSVLAFLIVYSR